MLVLTSPKAWERRPAALLAGATRYDVSFANSYMPLGAWLKEALSDVAEHPRLSALAAGGGSFWLQMS
jgi:hypothetical protein